MGIQSRCGCSWNTTSICTSWERGHLVRITKRLEAGLVPPLFLFWLPLPLGEGWGKGLRRIKKRREISFPLCPHPNPLPKGEGNFSRFLRRPFSFSQHL